MNIIGQLYNETTLFKHLRGKKILVLICNDIFDDVVDKFFVTIDLLSAKLAGIFNLLK